MSDLERVIEWACVRSYELGYNPNGSTNVPQELQRIQHTAVRKLEKLGYQKLSDYQKLALLTRELKRRKGLL